jgi:hypothetical protein
MKRKHLGITLSLPKGPRKEWALARDEAFAGPVYRKEVAYPGTFSRGDPDTGEIEFELEVTGDTMRRWVDTFNEMRSNGIEVPVPLGHSTNPEHRRGKVVRLSVEPSDSRDGDALFAYVKFRDEETAKQLAHSDVSLYMPPKVRDGRGRVYVRPIRHLAITDYPVVPELGPFTPVAASLVELSYEDDKDEEDEEVEEVEEVDDEEVDDEEVDDEEVDDEEVDDADKEDDAGEERGEAEDEPSDELNDDPEQLSATSISELADRLGVSYSADDNDDQIADLIVQKFSPDAAAEDEEADEVPEEDPMDDPTELAMPPTIPASLVKSVAKARVAQLDQLVRAGKLSPAAKTRLAQKYCSPEGLGIALSLESVGGSSDDFDDVVAVLSLNEPSFRIGEQTRAQGLLKPGAENPLHKAADARAAAAKAGDSRVRT